MRSPFSNLLVCSLFLAMLGFSAHAANPIALFHGLGDSCLFPGVNSLARKLTAGTGAYAACVESGSFIFSWFTTMEYQSEYACNALKSDPNFANKTIDIIGLSQGNLIARHIIQKCDFGGRVDKYISIAGPHMGVYTVPVCNSGMICDAINWVVREFVYTTPAQYFIGPAGYFKDAKSYQSYLNSCSFLPELNNEKDTKNETYRQRFGSLGKVMLVMFTDDVTINPKETAWFQYYDENLTLQTMEQTKLYQEDYIGLKTLDQSKKITKVELPGGHLRFTDEDVQKTFIPFLGGTERPTTALRGTIQI